MYILAAHRGPRHKIAHKVDDDAHMSMMPVVHVYVCFVQTRTVVITWHVYVVFSLKNTPPVMAIYRVGRIFLLLLLTFTVPTVTEDCYTIKCRSYDGTFIDCDQGKTRVSAEGHLLYNECIPGSYDTPVAQCDSNSYKEPEFESCINEEHCVHSAEGYPSCLIKTGGVEAFFRDWFLHVILPIILIIILIGVVCGICRVGGCIHVNRRRRLTEDEDIPDDPSLVIRSPAVQAGSESTQMRDEVNLTEISTRSTAANNQTDNSTSAATHQPDNQTSAASHQPDNPSTTGDQDTGITNAYTPNDAPPDYLSLFRDDNKKVGGCIHVNRRRRLTEDEDIPDDPSLVIRSPAVQAGSESTQMRDEVNLTEISTRSTAANNQTDNSTSAATHQPDNQTSAASHQPDNPSTTGDQDTGITNAYTPNDAPPDYLSLFRGDDISNTCHVVDHHIHIHNWMIGASSWGIMKHVFRPKKLPLFSVCIIG
eukprot:sb/3464282/